MFATPTEQYMTTKTNAKILAKLGACDEGVARARAHPTLRQWWEHGERDDMMWLIGEAHIHGTLPRRRLVAVALACAETMREHMPEASRQVCDDLRRWVEGDDSVDLDDVRRRACAAHSAALFLLLTASATATHAAYAATATRSAITIDEVCAALGLDPEQCA